MRELKRDIHSHEVPPGGGEWKIETNGSFVILRFLIPSVWTEDKISEQTRFGWSSL